MTERDPDAKGPVTGKMRLGYADHLMRDDKTGKVGLSQGELKGVTGGQTRRQL